MDPVDSKWCGATVYAWAIWTEMKEKNKEIATFKIAQELGGLELLDAKYEKQNFSRHSHEGYTIGVIEKGAQQFFRTGGNHIAPQDSIILVNADEVHNGHSASEGGWEYKAMYPDEQEEGKDSEETDDKGPKKKVDDVALYT